MQDVFRLAHDCGFQGIELMVTKREETQSPEYLSELAGRHNLPVRSIHAPFLMASRNVWGDYRSKIEKTVSMARVLGAGVVVVHLPYIWQLDYARWIHHHLNSYSRNCGVVVAVENAMMVNLFRPRNFSFFNSLNELKNFDNIVIDTSHFAIAGVDILYAWSELKERVRHIHLSNNYMKGFDDHALPFDGRLPLDRFLGLLRKDNYQGTVVLELGPGPLEARLGKERISKNLRRSIEYCRDCYQKTSA